MFITNRKWQIVRKTTASATLKGRQWSSFSQLLSAITDRAAQVFPPSVCQCRSLSRYSCYRFRLWDHTILRVLQQVMQLLQGLHGPLLLPQQAPSSVQVSFFFFIHSFSQIQEPKQGDGLALRILLSAGGLHVCCAYSYWGQVQLLASLQTVQDHRLSVLHGRSNKRRHDLDQDYTRRACLQSELHGHRKDHIYLIYIYISYSNCYPIARIVETQELQLASSPKTNYKVLWCSCTNHRCHFKII